MEVILLDQSLNLASAPIERYDSLMVRERYYDIGDFEWHVSADYLAQLLAAEYIYLPTLDTAMIIDGISGADNGKRSLSVTGQSLEGLLSRRVMDMATAYSGSIENSARAAVTTYALTVERAIPLLSLDSAEGYTDTAELQNKRGAQLDEWLRNSLRPFDMAYRIRYDYNANALKFGVWRGLDRRQSQSENSFAIFSTSFENLSLFEYSRSKADYRNYDIVKSRDGTKTTTVDKTNGNNRRELYVETDDDLTTAQMRSEAEAALDEYRVVETIGGEVQSNSGLVYGRDYNLGDLCDIEDDALGISGEARLTEMTTICEGGIVRQIPSFGEQYLNIKQYINRAIQNNN